MVTRERKEGRCLIKPCEEPIQVGEQYVRITKGLGSQRVTKIIHIDCLQSWVRFMADRRAKAPERTRGRIPLELAPEQREKRKRLHRRLRYIVKKMKVVADLKAAEKLNADYWEVLGYIELTGAPFSNKGTYEVRKDILSNFITQMKVWRKEIISTPILPPPPKYIVEQSKSSDWKPLPVSTVFTEAVETPELSAERKAELDQHKEEILERVARGYERIPEDEGGDYLA